MERFAASRVAVFGIGGVGGYVVEALVRSGIGNITIVDNDSIAVSNLNRQIIALNSTIF
jgi:tRNA A37 threonylcarbamoyladenosine dehydratase